MEIIRFLAKGISIIFHPIFMLTYMLILLLMVNPYLFAGATPIQKNILIIMVFATTVIIPGFSVILMKLLGFIDDFTMKDRKQRTIPYVMTGMFYLWLLINLYYNPLFPKAYTIFVLGATVALFIAFLINIFSKISMHGIGVGGLVGMVLITMFQFSYNSFEYSLPLLGASEMSMRSLLMIVILVAGLVGTSRLLLDAHEPEELYGGFFVGFCTQFLALFILGV